MMAHTGALLSRRDDPKEVGRRVMEQMANSGDRAIVARDGAPEGAVLDVQYEALVADPLGQLRRIYDFLELEWSPEAVQRMERWISGNPQHKYGVHRYGLSDFGLAAEEVDARFKRYRERFDVPRED